MHRDEEIEIFKTEKPNNIIEEKYSFEIIGFEKDELIEQWINQILNSPRFKPENEIQRTEEVEIFKTDKQENECLWRNK